MSNVSGKAVEEMDWLLPTDVQAEAIPLILGGGDVLMAAETGSGKTGAFCLPILQITWESLKDLQSGGGKKKSGDAASAASSDKWAMSMFDRGPKLAVSPDGLTCQSREQREWHGSRATRGVTARGKYYFEATVKDEGLCRVGFSTDQASLDLGTCRFGFGFGGTGKKSNNKQFDSYGRAFGKEEVLGCYLDLDGLEIYYTINGEDQGMAFSINNQFRGHTFYPAVVLKNAEMQFNFGESPFKYKPFTGYKGFSSADSSNVVNNSKKGSQVVQERKLINNAPQAIIIEPSRELAEQTLKQIQMFKKHLAAPAVTELLVVGGVNVKDQISALSNGVHIVVATPGRLEDLIQTGQLCLKQCRFFVLDEADGLLKQGYDGFISRLHAQIPKVTSDGRRLQMVVCSATLHAFEVKKMAEKLMYFPTWVDLKGQDSVPDTVHHVVVPVDPRQDRSWTSYRNPVQTDAVHAEDRTGAGVNSPEAFSEAVKLMKGEYCVRAIKEHNMDHGLIFCRTKLDCDNMERYFNYCGGGRNKNEQFSCVCLHGDRKPAERRDNLEKFKQKKVKFLICTDVAARGIDVGGLPFMINVTLPDEKSNYVHRIGRVGRAERMGLAISLVSAVPEKVWYHGQWCQSRGRDCYNTRLTDQKGCCMWYNEPQYLADIEEHLGVTIGQVDTDIKVAADEFDGKVVYGEKKKAEGSGYQGHAGQLASTVAALASLETQAQDLFLANFYKSQKMVK